MSRLEIDRGFNSKPVEKLPKWDVIKMVRDAITLETHLSSSQCFDSLIRSCHQMSEHARFLSFAFTRKISLSWFCWGRRHKRHKGSTPAKFSIEIALVTTFFLGFSGDPIESEQVKLTLSNVNVRFRVAKILNVLNILCILRCLVYAMERPLF
jgi:hypothetical protein